MNIINAKIFTMAGPVIENGYVEYNNKIISVGDMKDAAFTEAFDAKGAVLFPGFVDGHTHLGMCEDSLGFEGDDVNEMSHPCTPHLRAVDAVNTFDRCFDEALHAGITSVITGPGSANPIAGQAVAVKTYGKCIDDMTIKAPAAIKFALGENPKTVYNEKKVAPSTRMATAAIIREQLLRTQEYIAKRASDQNCDYDIRLEALALLFNNGLPAHFHAHRADDIFTAIRIAEEFNLKYAIIHCTQGYQIAQALSEKGVSVMAGPLIADRSKPELKEATPASPGVLSKAGVVTAIVTDHPVVPVQYLSVCAGLAVREGMDYYEALKAITVIPAEIFGISDRVGSIEAGKDADMVLFDKDPLTIAATPIKVIAGGVML